ncbi:hypothetical protein PGT21_010212 [Puccinia graminis f. sp. tritici]|uniref:Uncharacterized protein n=1 Tax=Puccinia graminis f. sp. tritici TaxID=56615 RepID=A0A5B0S9I1_PUCGR|nr:hypothetical protein PGT21_010212 [Puccinia graminis f. sp. tritici]KAA1134105.1 hypothetical protein PGTUg99_026688 [Puccinia graminis f. sp. tritici]
MTMTASRPSDATLQLSPHQPHTPFPGDHIQSSSRLDPTSQALHLATSARREHAPEASRATYRWTPAERHEDSLPGVLMDHLRAPSA